MLEFGGSHDCSRHNPVAVGGLGAPVGVKRRTQQFRQSNGRSDTSEGRPRFGREAKTRVGARLCRCQARRDRRRIPAGRRLLHAPFERHRRTHRQGLRARDDDLGAEKHRRHQTGAERSRPHQCRARPRAAGHIPCARKTRHILDHEQLSRPARSEICQCRHGGVQQARVRVAEARRHLLHRRSCGSTGHRRYALAHAASHRRDDLDQRGDGRGFLVGGRKPYPAQPGRRPHKDRLRPIDPLQDRSVHSEVQEAGQIPDAPSDATRDSGSVNCGSRGSHGVRAKAPRPLRNEHAGLRIALPSNRPLPRCA